MKFALHPLNARGMMHYILPLVVIIGVALVGTYYLVASHADITLTASTSTVKNASLYNYLTTDPGTGVSNTTTTVDGIGLQTVNQLVPGAQLRFNQSVKGALTNCYFVSLLPVKSAHGTKATVEFNSAPKSVTKTLTYDDVNSTTFREVCVGAGTDTWKGFNIANVSPSDGAYVLVYQELVNW